VCAGRVDSQSLQPEGRIEGLLLQKECTESKNSNTWSVFEEVPQGVRAGIFPKDLRIFQSSSGGIGSSKLSKKSSGGLVP
jgi:hypothetical protein